MARKETSAEKIQRLSAPYIRTANDGDKLRLGECDNPAGWWTVFRNDRPIHHFSDQEDALAMITAVAAVSRPLTA